MQRVILLLLIQTPICYFLGISHDKPCDFNKQCICNINYDYSSHEKTTEVNCERLELTELPRGMPSDRTLYNLDNNKFDFTEDKLLPSFQETFGSYGVKTTPEGLTLNYNPLKVIPRRLGEILSSLKELQLNRCQLLYLRKDTFEFFVNLQFITLNENKLTTIPGEIFKFHLDLRIVQLKRNILSHIPEKIYLGNFSLDLEGNPLVCDCTLKEVKNKFCHLDSEIGKLICTLIGDVNYKLNVCELTDTTTLNCREEGSTKITGVTTKPMVPTTEKTEQTTTDRVKLTTAGFVATSFMTVLGGTTGAVSVLTLAKILRRKKLMMETNLVEPNISYNNVLDMALKFPVADDEEKKKDRLRDAEIDEEREIDLIYV